VEGTLRGEGMKKLLLITLLVTSSASYADSKWEKLGSTGTEQFDFTYFIDKLTIKESNLKKTFYILRELNAAQVAIGGFKYRSSIVQYEQDCNKKTYRTKEFRAYTDKMGAGSLVFKSNKISDWISSVIDNMHTEIFNSICSK
jgi:hypothetical protein